MGFIILFVVLCIDTIKADKAEKESLLASQVTIKS